MGKIRRRPTSFFKNTKNEKRNGLINTNYKYKWTYISVVQWFIKGGDRKERLGYFDKACPSVHDDDVK